MRRCYSKALILDQWTSCRRSPEGVVAELKHVEGSQTQAGRTAIERFHGDSRSFSSPISPMVNRLPGISQKASVTFFASRGRVTSAPQLYDAPTVPGMVDPSSTYRLRALASEQRARESSDPAIKKEWEDLAIQWHLIAHVAAELRGHVPRIDTA